MVHRDENREQRARGPGAEKTRMKENVVGKSVVKRPTEKEKRMYRRMANGEQWIEETKKEKEGDTKLRELSE